MAAFSDIFRRLSKRVGPIMVEAVAARRKRPWMAWTYLGPYRSAGKKQKVNSISNNGFVSKRTDFISEQNIWRTCFICWQNGKGSSQDGNGRNGWSTEAGQVERRHRPRGIRHHLSEKRFSKFNRNVLPVEQESAKSWSYIWLLIKIPTHIWSQNMSCSTWTSLEHEHVY